MESKGSTKELKRVLGYGDLLSTAIGQIIGAGIMTLLGEAISLTGRSVPIAFFLAAILMICVSIPMIIIAGTVRVRGGQYTMTGMLAGETWSGFFIIMHILNNVTFGMYGLSFANYFIAFFGVGTTKVIAIIILTLFFVINITGVDIMARFQNIVVILMCIALGLFAAFGVSKVSPDYLTQDFMINGIGGLLQASGLLTFAVGESYVVVNLSAEAKNPTRDIPLAMIVSTVIVAIVYAFVGVVAAGVLPVSEVVGQSLDVVGKTILPAPVYAFFMVCGAMFAIISTLNAQYAWAPKPIMQACDDGWFPAKLAYVHPKFKTPVVLMGILYVIGLVCIITGLDISVLGNISIIAADSGFLIICIYLWRLPQVAGSAWEKSRFKVSPTVLKVCIVLGAAASALNIIFNTSQLSPGLLALNAVAIVVAYLWARFRAKSGKIHMEMSFEEI